MTYTQTKRRVVLALVSAVSANGSYLNGGSATLVPLTAIQKTCPDPQKVATLHEVAALREKPEKEAIFTLRKRQMSPPRDGTSQAIFIFSTPERAKIITFPSVV